MKKVIITFILSSMALTAQARVFQDLSMECSSSTKELSQLHMNVTKADEYQKGRGTSAQYATLDYTATVNGGGCNITTANLSLAQFNVVTGGSKALYSLPISLNCYSSNLLNHKFEAVLNIDSSQNSANVVYADESGLRLVPMTCTSKSYFERKKESLRFEIGS